MRDRHAIEGLYSGVVTTEGSDGYGDQRSKWHADVMHNQAAAVEALRVTFCIRLTSTYHHKSV